MVCVSSSIFKSLIHSGNRARLIAEDYHVSAGDARRIRESSDTALALVCLRVRQLASCIIHVAHLGHVLEEKNAFEFFKSVTFFFSSLFKCQSNLLCLFSLLRVSSGIRFDFVVSRIFLSFLRKNILNYYGNGIYVYFFDFTS